MCHCLFILPPVLTFQMTFVNNNEATIVTKCLSKSAQPNSANKAKYTKSLLNLVDLFVAILAHITSSQIA